MKDKAPEFMLSTGLTKESEIEAPKDFVSPIRVAILLNQAVA